ncbi:MAG TPA: chemotaxis protein CheA [Steroidobacteraceae bacterium]|nr:chemotaxis protein CheA [Steroidobacteraceae bacterium]
MNMDEVLPTFIAEGAEVLRDLESGLLACSQGQADAETINLIFRAVHTLKGSAGLFGLDGIVAFVHGAETTLDQVRQGHIPMDPVLISVLLRCKDHIEFLLESVSAGPGSPAYDATHTGGAELSAALRELSGDFAGVKPEPAADSVAAVVPPPRSAPSNVGRTEPNQWHISVRFGPEVLTAGMDPISFLRYLASFGQLQGMTLIAAALPAAALMNPEHCYLGFELGFRTAADREKIESTFDFVREDCTLRLLPPGSSHGDYHRLLQEAGVEVAGIRDILTYCAGLSGPDLEQLLQPQVPGSGQPTAPALQHAAPARTADGAGPGKPTASTVDNRTVRVAAQKLDSLITHIGELITAAAGANLIAGRSGNAALQESTSRVSALIEQVREGALQLRMVKIGGTFSRFQRVVHDVSAELGKQIQLVVSGEDAELDKTVVEQIADPLTHLVRNAIDHGIEAAALRAARGKPLGGTIKLNAFHDSGSIVIEVSDDGGGLKRDRILAKAQERGLIESGRTLTESEIFALIFEPGFSTAEAVTNLSGRGVGMDVVKRNITALRGTVTIRSTEGVGTTIAVRLPLTLAIINGFQVAIGNSIFVLPLESVEECIEFSTANGHHFTSLRGGVLPYIHLRELFGTSAAATRRQSIVVINYAGQRAGLVVDGLLGEFQTVIKPLGKMFRQVECVSGSSILGTGDVALILDVPALVQLAIARSGAAFGQIPQTAVA